MQKVWLVTGSGNGLGRDITEQALAAGNLVVATARKPEQLDDLVSAYGDQIRTVQHDVTNEEQCQLAVQTALEAFGRVDVLVNNAGYGDIRPFEQTPADDFRKLVETCLFGTVNMTRAVLPVMRDQRRGHIFQISSIGGRVAFAGNASYHAAKWGVGGFTEAIAQEAAPFGVVATTIEPGGMRTGFGNTATKNIDLLPDYEPSVGKVLDMVGKSFGRESGDPVKVAKLLLILAEQDTLPPHIILGRIGLETVKAVEGLRAESRDEWQAVGDWIDFDVAGELPTLPTR